MPNQIEVFRAARSLNILAEDIANTAEEKGFWSFHHMDIIHEAAAIPLKLALVAAEVSEALEVHRKDYGDDVDIDTRMTSKQEADFAEELADVIIRVLDICGFYEFHIGEIVADKMAKNADRPYRHDKRY